MAATIQYTVPNMLNGGAIVGLNFYNAAGELQLNAIIQQFQTAGTKSFTWNGNTNYGTTVGTDGCTWETLFRPDYPRAELIDYFISDFPRGPHEWEIGGGGSHGGTCCVTCDATSIMTRSGTTENVRNYVRMSLDMETELHSGWAVSNNPTLAQGLWDLWVQNYNNIAHNWGVSGRGYLYLHQVGKTTDLPDFQTNSKDSSIGEWTASGNWTGKRVDILTGTGLTRANWVRAWRPTGSQFIHADGNGSVVAVTYKNQGIIRLYGTNGTDFTKNRSSTDTRQVYAGTTLPILKEFTGIVNPTAVCVDDLGRAVVVVDGNTLKRFSTNGTVETLISNQPGMWKLDQNHTTKEWYQTFLGSVHQVKRYDSNFQVLQTYGKLGGRGAKGGLYNKMDFWNLYDVAAFPGPQLGFVAVENFGVSRLVHFANDGTHVKEKTGAAGWLMDFEQDPINPNLFWCRHSVMNLGLWHYDFATKKRTLLGIYENQGMNGIVPFRWDEYNLTNGGGYGNWSLKKHKGYTYLCMREFVCVLRFNHRTYELKPVNRSRFGSDSGDTTDQWVDANGNGMRDTGETTPYTYKEYPKMGMAASHQAYGNFDYYRWTEGASTSPGGEIRIQRHIGWNAIDSPIYEPPPGLTYTKDIRYFDKARRSYGRATQIVTADEKNVFAFYSEQAPGADWNVCDDGGINIFVTQPDGTGKWLGKVSKWVPRPTNGDQGTGKLTKLPDPGTNHNMKNAVGCVYNVAVFTEYDGGFDGLYPAVTYAWNGRGFYIGGLFDRPDLTKGQLHEYHHNGDNAVGRIWPDYRTGEVFYTAGRDSDGILYRIRNMNPKNWKSQKGTT